MFSKDRRIHTTKDIIQVLRRGIRLNSGTLSYSFIRKPGNLSRIAVIVDKKVSKKAVLRNLLKRRTRSLLRSFTLPAGDSVIRLYPGTEETSFEELGKALEQCLQKIK